MPPIVAEFLGSIIRWGLTLLLGYLVKKGVVDGAATAEFITFVTASILVLGWGLYQKYRAKLVQLTAQTMYAGSTEEEVKAKIASGIGVPSVMTAATSTPIAF